jgi:hypothetical protein
MLSGLVRKIFPFYIKNMLKFKCPNPSPILCREPLNQVKSPGAKFIQAFSLFSIHSKHQCDNTIMSKYVFIYLFIHQFMVYLQAPSAAHAIYRPVVGCTLNNELGKMKRCGYKQPRYTATYHFRICLEGLKKITKNLSIFHPWRHRFELER